MNRESAKRNLEHIKAFANGESLQWRLAGSANTWMDCDEHEIFSEQYEFRRKPSPQFRPWTAGEFKILPCVLRQAFSKQHSWQWQVLAVRHDGLHICDGKNAETLLWSDLFARFEHSTDGCSTFKPCGVQISGEEVA